MFTIEDLIRLSEHYQVPIEDVLFIAVNVYGLNLDCQFNRIRMDFRLADSELFAYAKKRGELDYFLALPVNPTSQFVLSDNTVLLNNRVIGEAINPMEDVSDLHYFRRKKTALNFNPNSQSSCAGCRFCYTSRLTPNEKQKIETGAEVKIFFENWMKKYGLTDLSHLIRIAVVTGNYSNSDDLCQFLLELKQVVQDHRFGGEIFYLGSQIATPEQLRRLAEVQPLCICFSMETFERRDLLRPDKRMLGLDETRDVMDRALELGHAVNFSYIVGMEPLQVMERNIRRFKEHINRFPIINTFQRHKFQGTTLADPNADRLEYYLDARRILEQLFGQTSMRPFVWENYRSLWFLAFDKEPLHGIRTPY